MGNIWVRHREGMTRRVIILLLFISIDWILYVADMVPRKQTMSYKAACRTFFGSVPRINTFSKGSMTGQGSSWAVMQSHQRPQPTLWGTPELKWPFTVLPDWGKEISPFNPIGASHWIQVFYQEGITLSKAALFNWEQFLKRNLAMCHQLPILLASIEQEPPFWKWKEESRWQATLSTKCKIWRTNERTWWWMESTRQNPNIAILLGELIQGHTTSEWIYT